jgi:hypothetical protein
VAAHCNAKKLPQKETVGSILESELAANPMQQRKAQMIPSVLPEDGEATVLVNPSLQVYSEELKHAIAEQQYQQLRIARLR